MSVSGLLVHQSAPITSFLRFWWEEGTHSVKVFSLPSRFLLVFMGTFSIYNWSIIFMFWEEIMLPYCFWVFFIYIAHCNICKCTFFKKGKMLYCMYWFARDVTFHRYVWCCVQICIHCTSSVAFYSCLWFVNVNKNTDNLWKTYLNFPENLISGKRCSEGG